MATINTKTEAKYVIKGLEMYLAKVKSMHTQAMTLGMFDQAKEIQEEMEAIQKLSTKVQELK